MTEQQIDAEVRRYRPYLNVNRVWVWYSTEGEVDSGNPQCLPRETYDRLITGVRSLWIGWGYCTYPTREAAFADLRQAIAATGSNAGS